MAEPIFNIVRVDNLETSEGLDYTATADMVTTYDEIMLVDDAGEPCAEPIAPVVEDLDERHDYSDGSVGETQRIRKQNIRLAVDGLDGDQWTKLKRWHQDRAEVRFSPGFGRHTELGWRPVPGGASYSDLTGKYTFTESGDATYNHVWDERDGIIRDFSVAGQRIIPTPGGAGQVFERGYGNLAYGQSWTVFSGATTTVSTATDGFGHTDFPDAVRIARTADAADSVVLMALASPTLGTSSIINYTALIKGRVPPGTFLRIMTAIGGITTVSSVQITGDYSDWTRIEIQGAETFTSGVWIRLHMTGLGGGVDSSGDFLLAAEMAYEEPTSGEYLESFNNYVNKTAASTTSYITTSATVAWPRAGTLHTVFYVPESFDDTLDGQRIGLVGQLSSIEGMLYLVAYNSNPRLRAIFYMSYPTPNANLHPYVDGGLINTDDINTLTVTWSPSTAYMYLNGALIASSTTDYVKNQTDRIMRIGYCDAGGGSWPFLMCGVRLENDVWDADRVAWEHATANNSAAQAVVVGARGRTYKIRSIPDQPIVSVGQSTWRGVIELEQVSYDEDTADITTKE